MTENKKPRQWTLNLRDEMFSEGQGIVYYKGTPPRSEDVVNVVELSAYEALEKQVAEYEEALSMVDAVGMIAPYDRIVREVLDKYKKDRK